MSTAGPEGFRPVHEAHAIEQLTAVVTFDRSLSDAELAQADAIMMAFANNLPSRAEIRGIGFQIGPSGVMPLTGAHVSDSPNGIVRFMTEAGVNLKELRLERSSIFFRTAAYTRWDKVWGEAIQYFEALLPCFGQAMVASYSLVYHDKFVWHGDRSNCKASTLLRSDSPYVAPGVLETSDLWHCHSGRFIESNNGSKRLEVVDLDCVEESENRPSGPQQSRVVRISTNLTDTLIYPESKAAPIYAAAGRNELNNGFIEFHNKLKEVFLSIVNDETSIKVGLKNAD